jgi:hypothetical protein
MQMANAMTAGTAGFEGKIFFILKGHILNSISRQTTKQVGRHVAVDFGRHKLGCMTKITARLFLPFFNLDF